MSPLVRSSLKRYAIGLCVLIALAAMLIFAPQRAGASVTLNYFRAAWHDDLETVIIEWQTATQLNTVGFIVQRSTSPGSGYVDITEVIPAQGDPLTGWTYGPVADDPTALTIGVTYWYRLVIINATPPIDVIPPVAVLAGTASTVTPTPTGTPGHVGLSLAPAVAQLPAVAGQSVTHTLRLTNIGDVTCQIDLFHTSSAYPVVVSPVSVVLAADTGIDVSVRVLVPVAPIVYSNTVDVVAMTYGADPPSATARVITVVWWKTYLPIVIYH